MALFRRLFNYAKLTLLLLALQAATAAAAQTQIDVLVVFTTNSLRSTAVSYITNSFNSLNLFLTRFANTKLKIVGSTVAASTGGVLPPRAIWDNIRYGRGMFANVNVLRDRVKADIVVALVSDTEVDNSVMKYCGYAPLKAAEDFAANNRIPYTSLVPSADRAIILLKIGQSCRLTATGMVRGFGSMMGLYDNTDYDSLYPNTNFTGRFLAAYPVGLTPWKKEASAGIGSGYWYDYMYPPNAKNSIIYPEPTCNDKGCGVVYYPGSIVTFNMLINVIPAYRDDLGIAHTGADWIATQAKVVAKFR